MKQTNYAKYLEDVVNEEGILSNCYETFYTYSVGNQILAAAQLWERDEDIQPIATYKQWEEKGRQVKKGAKALELLIPFQYIKKYNDGTEIKDANGEPVKGRGFKSVPRWFGLHSTEPVDGAEEFAHEQKSPEWDKEIALKNLNITEERFDYPDGNCQGYAKEGVISINPVAQYPHKTRFHELAHNVLGHCSEGTLSDSEFTPKDIREVEAESVAYILCQILGLDGAKESRGYVQHWLRDDKIENKSALKIFAAADKILKAGKEEK